LQIGEIIAAVVSLPVFAGRDGRSTLRSCSSAKPNQFELPLAAAAEDGQTSEGRR
jgi:hypothetical protein